VAWRVWIKELDLSLRATPPLETILSCSRSLPFDEALTIADAGLHSEMVTRTEAGDLARGAGAARVRKVVRHADGNAANPFESVLRAITIEAALRFDVQHPIEVTGMTVHPDLADLEARVILEADSWEFHTGRKAHVRDCWRYNELVAEGWSVLRFTWWIHPATSSRLSRGSVDAHQTCRRPGSPYAERVIGSSARSDGAVPLS